MLQYCNDSRSRASKASKHLHDVRKAGYDSAWEQNNAVPGKYELALPVFIARGREEN